MITRGYICKEHKFKSCLSAQGARMDVFFWGGGEIAPGIRLGVFWAHVGEELEYQAQASKCIHHPIESPEVFNWRDEISKECFSCINILNKHAI